jgi:hypothetical protein
MNRLTSGMIPLFALLAVTGCGSEPTESFRDGVARLDASPSTILIRQGKTGTVQVTAVDGQGNPVASAMEIKSVGAGITVKRDSAYAPQYNGTEISVPAEAPTFQFIVSADQLASTSFTVAVGDKEVTVPVNTEADPAAVPIATVTSTGPNASDPTVLTLPAPFVFGPDVAVAFDAGGAIVTGVSDDGRTLTIFPPPGATSKGTVTGIALEYLPQVSLTDSTDVALTIGTSVPAQPGTDNPATAPTVALPASGGTTAFYDGAAFGSPVCGEANDGVPCQLYKISLPADGSFDATIGWSNTTDLGLYVLSADGTTDTDQHCDDLGNGADGGEESCTITLPAGDYLLAIVNFGPFYSPVDPAPDWISLAVTTP